MKKIILSLMFVGLLFTLVGCGGNDNVYVEDFSSVKREDMFIVGLECNYEPFNWTEDERTPYNYPIDGLEGKFADGYDVQIAKAVASALGKTLVIKKIEWDSLITSLETQQIDAIIAGMSPTAERSESVLFTDGYYRSTHVAVVRRNGSYASATSINGFTGANFIGQAGTLYDTLIDQMQGVTHGVALSTVPEIVTSILNNRCDGTILEYPVAQSVVASNPELTIIEFTDGFEVADEDVLVSIALRLGENALANQINSILEAIPNETRNYIMELVQGRIA